MTAPWAGPTPKIELHVHFEGTVRPETLLVLARRNGERLPAETVEGLRPLYEFVDFAHFIRTWMLTTNCLRTADDFRRIVVEYAAEAAGHGARYLEGIFSPAERVRRGVRWTDIFEGYADGAAEAYERHGVRVRLTPDVDRELEPAAAEECARQAVRYRERGVVGFGLGGPELAAPAKAFARAVAIARDGGLAFVPHGGEEGGPDSVRDLLELAPARIRHGIRAAEDDDLLAELRERSVVLDVCPTSNLRTRVVESEAAHPLPRLVAAGLLCTVGTDDPAMFGTDLGREHELAARLGLAPERAYAAGVAGVLCDDTTRDHLVAVGRRAYG
ncbi:adenosine deaminase [Micromonospora sp. CA-263727]|uniref:adenosine deaminase n=1 Tax=Micromonospora sp. CA-263727 TaxID=3239967 RepID=UPI003D8EE4B4